MNALHYSKSQIIIRLYKENTYAYLSFEHDGEEFKDPLKTFDFFKNVNKTENTGMGMYLVKKLCDLFGYEIKIKGKRVLLKLN